MNEVMHSALLKKLDKEWLIRACDLLDIDYDNIKGKRKLFNKITEVLNDDPTMVIFLMNPLIMFKFIDSYESIKKKSKTQTNILKACNRFKASIETIDTDKIVMFQPLSYLESSLELIKYLLETGDFNAVFKEKNEVIDETVSISIQSGLIWNLICYYGAIEIDTFIEIYQKIIGHNIPLGKGTLSFILYHIALSYNEDIYIEDINGKDYVLTDVAEIDPEEIIEESSKINVEYKIPDMEEVMDMFLGITTQNYLSLAYYLRESFVFEDDEEFPEPLNKIPYLTYLLVTMKGSHAKYLNDYLMDELGLIEKEPGISYINFVNCLFELERFGYKGHTKEEIMEMDGIVDDTEMWDEFEFFSNWIDNAMNSDVDYDILNDMYEEEIEESRMKDDNVINFITAKKKKKDEFLN